MKTTTTPSAMNQVANTEKKARKQRSVKSEERREQPTTEQTAEVQPTAQSSKLLVFKRSKNDRFYVYLLGVQPEDNIGCNCKSAKSAMRFMLWKKRELGAAISQKHFNELRRLAASES